MKRNKAVIDLIKIIDKKRSVLQRIDNFYTDFLNTQDRTQRDVPQAIVIADILSNYYTCVETIFFRILQFFQNTLRENKWHQDLLESMNLEIDDMREAVISDETYRNLLELLKFRYFKRYYFEFEYDWDKLEFLQKKYNKVKEILNKDLDNFTDFLRLLLL